MKKFSKIDIIEMNIGDLLDKSVRITTVSNNVWEGVVSLESELDIHIELEDGDLVKIDLDDIVDTEVAE